MLLRVKVKNADGGERERKRDGKRTMVSFAKMEGMVLKKWRKDSEFPFDLRLRYLKDIMWDN